MGDVKLCPRQRKTFSCNIILNNSSLSRLEWQIDFRDEISVPSITQSFTSVDPEGLVFEADRMGMSFHFNLTSKDEQSLVSVMNIMILDENRTDMIDGTSVSCGIGEEQAMLYAITGIINFTDYYS